MARWQRWIVSWLWAVGVAVCGLLPQPAAAESVDGAADASARSAYIRSHFAKSEHRVVMRDGVALHTTVYVPYGLSKPAPMLLVRTPYGVHPYGASKYPSTLCPWEALEKGDTIFVFQDVRGRWMSEGTFENMRPHTSGGDARTAKVPDESTDTWDTAEWLVRNVEGNNGKIGVWGISYPGFYASMALLSRHPAIVAVSPQAPIADWYWDDVHRNGALSLALTFHFFVQFGVPRPGPHAGFLDRFDAGSADPYRFFLDLGPVSELDTQFFRGGVPFWSDIVAHPDYDDFWKARSTLPHFKNHDTPSLVVGGWYDAEDLFGVLATYQAIERSSPKNKTTLVMGPWYHGGWTRSPGDKLGEADFGFATSKSFEELAMLPFWRRHLQGVEGPALPEALMFDTGAHRWREYAQWPPADREERSLFLAAEGATAWKPPSETSRADFISDPNKPVPYTKEWLSGWSRGYMAEDQRFVSRRPDVLTYESAPLEADLTVAGEIAVELFVSTTGTDADWVVKLVDVQPVDAPRSLPGDVTLNPPSPDLRGAELLVRSDIFRSRYRGGFDRPAPLTPGRVELVRFSMPDVLHTFRRGHRLGVQIQSSMFPLFDRNPQTYVPNIYRAEKRHFVVATHSVHHGGDTPSSLKLPVMAQHRGAPKLAP
jgi:hypothetical protein